MAADYLCNLVIPGAAKSGTSALHEYLDQHPNICMSSSKEPHHFCLEEKYRGGATTHNALFTPGPEAKYFGESSTGYMIWPPAVTRIARSLAQPKIIIVLRDPVERAFSHYRWRIRLGLEKRSFLEAVTVDGFGYDPERPHRFGYMAYLQFSQYSRYLPLWKAEFGNDCLVISADDLRLRPQYTLDECYEFLCLPSVKVAENASNATDALGVRPARSVTRLASRLPAPLRRSRTYAMLRQRALAARAPTPPREMTAQERAYVETALADDILFFRSIFHQE